MSLNLYREQRFFLLLFLIVICGLAATIHSGCTSRSSSYLEARRHILSSEIPENIHSIADVYSGYEEGQQVALVGRIFASLGSPFDSKNAAFNLIELPKPGHNHENPGDCPFCKREMENAAMAIVQIVDASGQILKPSADELLGLKKNQDIVVCGAVTKVGEIMVVNALSLHLLTDETALNLAQQIHGQEKH